MMNEMFFSINDRHLQLLAEVGVLKYIIANKGADVQVSIYYYILGYNVCHDLHPSW